MNQYSLWKRRNHVILTTLIAFFFFSQYNITISVQFFCFIIHHHPTLTENINSFSLCRTRMAVDQLGHPDVYRVFRDPQGNGGAHLQDPVFESGQSGDLRPTGGSSSDSVLICTFSCVPNYVFPSVRTNALGVRICCPVSL